MSRGRGGPPIEHYHRPPLPQLQAKQQYYRAGPLGFHPRAPPQQAPHPNVHSYLGPVPPLVPPSAHSQPLYPSAPPPPSHSPALSQQSSCPSGPNSFRQQQVHFLRGQNTEAPQFRVSPRGAQSLGRGGPNGLYNESNQAQAGYSRYSQNSSRGRGGYSSERGRGNGRDFGYPPSQGPPRGPTGPRFWNQKQTSTQKQGFNRQWSLHADCADGPSFSEGFQSLSLDRERSYRGRVDRGVSFDKASVCSSNNSNNKSAPTFQPPDIREQVLQALADLSPGEKLQAKCLAKTLRCPKKFINQALYGLERDKKASKHGESPPEWTVYVEPQEEPESRDSDPESPRSQPREHSVESQERPSEEDCSHFLSVKEEDVVIAAEIQQIEAKGPEGDKEEDYYVESDSHSSSSESSESYRQHSQSQTQQPSINSSSNEELDLDLDESDMADCGSNQKELILQYLLEAGEATALVISKNLGLRGAKQVNPTLYAMEKQGDVSRNAEVTPHIWELSVHRRERMERSLKAERSAPAKVEGMGSGFQAVPPGLECLEANAEAEDESNGGQWATDDIPEFLNAISRDGGGTVAVSLAAPPPQNLRAKLQEVRAKNPVSGLMEFAQYQGHNCEFLLLDQSGPSHDPRFRMQVMLDGRLFPVAEASNKKVAKKDAAAATLRILLREIEGGGAEEGLTAGVDQAMDPTSDVPEVVEGPPQALSRSLPGGKNPVSMLMEYSQRTGNPIEFINTGQEGPPHDPRFMFRVKIGESLCAESSAPSKKAARQLAAEEAVKELMADGKLQLNKPQFPLCLSGDEGGFMPACPSLPPLTEEELRSAHEAGVGDLISHLNNNAVSGLLEYARARGFAAEIRLVGQSGPPHEPKFTYQAKLGGRWFPPVCASNKKQGKQEAADAALRVLIGEAEKAARTGELTPAELPLSGGTIHDQIAMLSHQRFNALTTRIQHSLLGRKILATVVMKRGEGLGTVVSLGTGNRCVKGEELSLKGDTVNDCHAEIISRRGFIRFLYAELLKHCEGSEDSIFEPAEENKLRIKPDTTFHLYISTAPCGDGALFDKSCSEDAGDGQGHQPLFENAKQGKLRTKVENGEGTIPVESSTIVPTWDGIQHGERLRTMSCSDKILRWNVLGLQGALLSNFLHPIYLASITLGYLYSHGHLTRAVCCRLARDGEAFSKSLPAPYTLNHPEVGRVSVYDSTRHTGKTKESSVNWSQPDHITVEVLDGTKGKLDGYAPRTTTRTRPSDLIHPHPDSSTSPKLDVSRVSKSNIFRQFRSLCQQCGRQDLLALPSYAQAKMAAMSFQVAKQQFFDALGSHGYGAWIGKPLEEKSFDEAAASGGHGAGSVANSNQGYNNNNSYGSTTTDYNSSQWGSSAYTQAM
ncbi:double-stranded RNA-specific adenosine deaminase isoform 1-T4 [Salvelinus alpinus]